MSLIQEYPDIASLLGGYFHQDWMHDYATPDDAVGAFIDESPLPLVQAASRQLRTILSRYPESQWANMLHSINCYYRSDDDVGWLKALQARLESVR